MDKMVFLDANIYLHYQPFHQIDWRGVLGGDRLTIVIPPVTVRELNRQKELHPRAGVRRRAGATLKRLSALFESGARAELRDGVDVLFEDRDPVIDFSAYGLSGNIQDDELIASMIMCRDETPGAEVALVTADAGLLLCAKADRQAICTVTLQAKYKARARPDPDQKRIRDLERQVRELRLRTPELSLAFEDGGQHATFVLPRPLDFTQEELESRLEEVKQQHPAVQQQPNEPRELSELMQSIAASAAIGLGLDAPSPEEMARYNREIREFYAAYVGYLREDAWFRNLERRTARLAILLANDGTAPAEDIEILMYFPGGLEVTDAEHRAQEPRPPQPPRRPRTRIELLSEQTRMPWSMLAPLAPHRYAPEAAFQAPNVSPPTIRRTSSYEVEVHVDKVKHGLRESFDPLYVVFESYEGARSFHIDYQVLASNVPQQITGQLHVVIEKDQGTGG
jgi:hypothetical protein